LRYWCNPAARILVLACSSCGPIEERRKHHKRR
jgi:hypothetical protein